MATHRRFTALQITILFTLLSTSAYFALPPIVRADERLSDLRDVFYNGRYAEVLTRLYDYRERPYGKQAEVDYMIGSSLCRTGNRDKARRRFEWILSRYRLESRQRNIIEQALRQCSVGGQSRPALFRESTVTSVGERNVGVSGKGGTITRDESLTAVTGSIVAVTSETAEVIRDIAPKEFESRLFDLSQRDKAIQRVATLVGPDYEVQSVGPFVLANSRSSSPAQALTIGRGLERYASFYASQFDIPKPTKFITVYIVSYGYEMHRLARTLHGIQVSRSSIGYSFPFDLSMVGILDNIQLNVNRTPFDQNLETQFGTHAHELFHLMVRNDFGDIPPWLEEGMASLYEVSESRGNYIAGVPNWRGQILAKFRRERPSIEQLLKMDWRSFDGTEKRLDVFEGTEERQYFRRQAINHATARYLMLYLQENQKLADVYKAFRHQNIDELKDVPEEEAVRLLASVVQKSLPEFDKDFQRWLLHLTQAQVN